MLPTEKQRTYNLRLLSHNVTSKKHYIPRVLYRFWVIGGIASDREREREKRKEKKAEHQREEEPEEVDPTPVFPKCYTTYRSYRISKDLIQFRDTSEQRRQSGLKSGGSWIRVKNISIFAGKFPKTWPFTATSWQIILFIFKSHHFPTYFL